MVERFTQTLLDQLSMLIEYHQHIPFLMMAYRSAIHESNNSLEEIWYYEMIYCWATQKKNNSKDNATGFTLDDGKDSLF